MSTKSADITPNAGKLYSSLRQLDYTNTTAIRSSTISISGYIIKLSIIVHFILPINFFSFRSKFKAAFVNKHLLKLFLFLGHSTFRDMGPS